MLWMLLCVCASLFEFTFIHNISFHSIVALDYYVAYDRYIMLAKKKITRITQSLVKCHNAR